MLICIYSYTYTNMPISHLAPILIWAESRGQFSHYRPHRGDRPGAKSQNPMKNSLITPGQHVCQCMHVCNVKSSIWENIRYLCVCVRVRVRVNECNSQTIASLSIMKANRGPLSGSKADASLSQRSWDIKIHCTAHVNPNWKTETLRRTKAGTTGSPSPHLPKGLFTHLPYA